jgi:hypothetical protein
MVILAYRTNDNLLLAAAPLAANEADEVKKAGYRNYLVA